MASNSGFSTTAVFWLIAVGFIAFAGGTAVSVFGTASTAGPSAVSTSAIGHRAFAETLRRTEVPVVVSRNDSANKAGDTALLVVAEPLGRLFTEDTIGELLRGEPVTVSFPVLFSEPTTLFVLPKRTGGTGAGNSKWLATSGLLPESRVESVLQVLLPGARVLRPDPPPVWLRSGLPHTPTLADPQLVDSSKLRPILGSRNGGLLIGEFERGSQRIWVLSDPDIIANHGLGDGENAQLAHAIVEALRPVGGAVIFDETIHGLRQDQSLWRALFEFPLVVATIQGAAAILVLILAAAARFGAPVPAPRPLKEGKAALLDNIAGLLQYGGHGPELLRRYFAATRRNVARQLHAPRTVDGEALDEWIDRAGEARGANANLGDLRRETDAAARAPGAEGAALLTAAQRLHRWKQEIIHGP